MPASDSPSTTARSRLGQLSVRASPADLYDAWLIAEVAATLALDAWRRADRRDKDAAHEAYVIALDAEAAAADRLQARLAGGEPLIGRPHRSEAA